MTVSGDPGILHIMELLDWEGRCFSYFENRRCEFFPCHTGADKKDFNCLFCYCPLYPLGEGCGGNFVYLENGQKDCGACLFPHRRENYGKVIDRLAR